MASVFLKEDIDFSERDFAPKRLMGDSIIILLMTVINDDV